MKTENNKLKYSIAAFVVFFGGFSYLQANIAVYDSLLSKESPKNDTIDWLVEQKELNDSTLLDEFSEDDDNGDTTNIILGKKKIQIIEEDDETSLKIKKLEEEENDNFDYGNENEWVKHSWKDFKGHWAGMEFGLNNYVDEDFSIARTEETEFLDLNTSRSWNINLNFAQYSIGFGSDKIGIVTGMGFEWSNYHFSNDSSVIKEDGRVQTRNIPENTRKNRLQTTYLTIPLLIETQFLGNDREERIHVAAGVIGGIKLFSNTMIKYSEDGTKKKSKNKSDFYLSPLRYAFTVRAGYKAVKLYANYYLTPLFIADRGPELYPVAAGIVFSF